MSPRGEIGVVVIGRNEKRHLAAALRSALRETTRTLYVDSGSTDGSPALAASLGVRVLELDPSLPMSAARARNEGFQHVVRLWPGLPYVQFLDGDCELVAGWADAAVRRLDTDPSVGVVCGRVRERRRNETIYNRLFDIEFNRPPGSTRSCGGNFMCRAEAFAAVGGFNPSVAAGEEPELCLRLRRAGWRVVRLAEEMALHDSGMSRFGQWWRRAVRSGHAYAQAVAMHGREPERFGLRETLAIWFWALALPGAGLALAWPTGGYSLLVLLAYPAQVARTAWARRQPDESRADAWLYGVVCVLGKWPQLEGQVRFVSQRLVGRAPTRMGPGRSDQKAQAVPAAGAPGNR